jgi:hypothetical protein
LELTVEGLEASHDLEEKFLPHVVEIGGGDAAATAGAVEGSDGVHQGDAGVGLGGAVSFAVGDQEGAEGGVEGGGGGTANHPR